MAYVNLKDYAFFKTINVSSIESDTGDLPTVMKNHFDIDATHSHANWMIDDDNGEKKLLWQGVLKIKVSNAEIVKIKNKDGDQVQVIEFPDVNEYLNLNNYADFDSRNNTYSIYCHEWGFAIQKKHSYKKCGSDFLEIVKNIGFIDSSITSNTANTISNTLTVYNYQTGKQKITGYWDQNEYNVNYYNYAYGKTYSLPYVPKQPVAMGFATDEEKSFICSNWDSGVDQSTLKINIDEDGNVWFNNKSFGNIYANQYFLFEQVLDATYTHTLDDGNEPYTKDNYVSSFNSQDDSQFLTAFDKFVQVAIDKSANTTTPTAYTGGTGGREATFSTCYYGPKEFNVYYTVSPRLVCNKITSLYSNQEYSLQDLYQEKRGDKMPSDFVSGIAKRYFTQVGGVQKVEIYPSWAQQEPEEWNEFFGNSWYDDRENNYPRWCSTHMSDKGSGGTTKSQSNYTVQYWIGGNTDGLNLTTNLANCLISRKWGEITTSIMNYYTLKTTQTIPSFTFRAWSDKFETLAIWTASGVPEAYGDPNAEYFGPTLGGGGLGQNGKNRGGFDRNYTFYQNLIMSVGSEFNVTETKVVRSSSARERTGLLYDPNFWSLEDYLDKSDRDYISEDSRLYRKTFYETMIYDGSVKRASWNWEFNLGQSIYQPRKLLTLIML